jgi:hypothetical protein
MNVAVLASGESIQNLPEILDYIDVIFFVNSNTSSILEKYISELKSKKIYQIANRMLPSLLKPSLYDILGIKLIYLTVPEYRRTEVLSTTNKLDEYKLAYKFVPKQYEWVFRNFNNITFYGIVLASEIYNPQLIHIMGLDFWEGNYTFKDSTDYQKTIPEKNNLYEKFNVLIDKYDYRKFTIHTVSNKILEKKNLSVKTYLKGDNM